MDKQKRDKYMKQANEILNYGYSDEQINSLYLLIEEILYSEE